MRLHHVAIERVQRVLPKPADEINFNRSHLLLRRLRPPVSLAKRKVAVANKPLEGSRAVFQDSAPEALTSLLGNFHPEGIARPRLWHLGFEFQKGPARILLFLVGCGIKDASAEIP